MAEADDLANLQRQISTLQQAGHPNQDIQDAILADPKWAGLYTSGKMPLLVPHTWGQEAQMTAEQFAQGIPSVIGLPGTLLNLPHQLQPSIPEGPSWLPTSGGVANWVGQQERNLLGVTPIEPLSPRERLGAAAAAGIGASVVPLGGSMGIAGRMLSGATGSIAGETVHEVAPGLGPLAPLAASIVAGGAVAPTAINMGLGPRTYSQILDDPAYNVTPKSVRNPNIRDDMSDLLKSQLQHDTQSPTGPTGVGGVRNTDLRQGKVDWFTNLPDDQALFALQKDRDLAIDFAHWRPDLTKQAGGAILSRYDNIHIPNMDKADTLDPVFGSEDANTLRRQYNRPTADWLQENKLLRAVLSERNLAIGGAVSGAASVLAHQDPALAAALTVTGGVTPYIPRAAAFLNRHFPGFTSGARTGVRATAPQIDPRRSWLGIEPYPGAPDVTYRQQ